MDKEIKDLKEKYFNVRYSIFRNYSVKHHHKERNIIFREINSKNDVELERNAVRNILSFYSKECLLLHEDIIRIEKAIGRYEIALGKIFQCYGYKEFDFDYTAKELEGLIEDINKFEELLSEIRIKLSSQD